MNAHLLPKVVFAQVVSVVAGEDDDGVVLLAGCLQRGENLADQGIDEGLTRSRPGMPSVGLNPRQLAVVRRLPEFRGYRPDPRDLGGSAICQAGKVRNFFGATKGTVAVRIPLPKEGLFHILVFA